MKEKKLKTRESPNSICFGAEKTIWVGLITNYEIPMQYFNACSICILMSILSIYCLSCLYTSYTAFKKHLKTYLFRQAYTVTYTNYINNLFYIGPDIVPGLKYPQGFDNVEIYKEL